MTVENNLADLRQSAFTLMASPKYARFFQNWSEPWEFSTPEITTERLRQAGFTAVQCWLEPAPFALPDAPTFRHYLATVVFHRHTARITDAQLREEFLDQLVEAGRPSGFKLSYWRLNVDAKRHL